MQVQSQSSYGFRYKPMPGCYDEALSAEGAARPAWKPLEEQFRKLGVDQLARKWHEARQIIRENGVTYNVYGDPDGANRPWQLDPLPHPVGVEEAKQLEAGLIQRARLLNAILVDLYGPRELLTRRLLPPELIFDHPGFLRPCHGISVPGDIYLHLYAADVGRGPDGRFWILSDRTQSPSGAGYALENRIVVSRMLPEAFNDCRVRRLALYFQSMRDSLRALAPHNRDNPRIVLLTPGPHNETYFEHAYLARYLGYTLVEGSDLTVRDNRVYLKVLGGLQQVDVILRRLDDDYCDPLEFRNDSCLGIAGLMQAVRTGHVAVANALGSGLVESPALMPFLPGICRYLFNEELKFPSIATWWCGQPAALEYVLGHLPSLVVRGIHRGREAVPVFGKRLDLAELAVLAAQIKKHPANYVAQEHLLLSTAPVLIDRGFESRHIVLRTYLSADWEGRSYTMMPGGLTRMTRDSDSMTVSMQSGGGSKDTWFLSEGPVNTFSLLAPTTQPVELSRGGNDLPSRAADNLFWLGRYTERADAKARLLRGILVRLTEKSGLSDVTELPVLLRSLSNSALTPVPPSDPAPEFEERNLRREIFDPRRTNSLAAIVRTIHQAASGIRDRISTDMWRILSNLKIDTREETSFSEVLDTINRDIGILAAFGGLVMDSMTRSQGWRFLNMGRRLERSLNLLHLLDGALVPPNPQEALSLEAVLEIADSLMTYRRRYLSNLQTAPVLDLLLADETNPRSLAFQVLSLSEDVSLLPREDDLPGHTAEERLMLSCLTTLRLAEIESLVVQDSAGVRPRLHDLLFKLDGDLRRLSEIITRHYLIHLQRLRHLAL